MSNLVCLGFGYCARHYAAAFGSRFERIVGTSRSPLAIRIARAETLVFDGVPIAELRMAVRDATHLLISAAPAETGDPMMNALGRDIEAASQLQSIVYLSSLGVYGDHGGTWIDETAPAVPTHARGGARVAAEAAWRALGHKCKVPVAILRLAGIYGPGQNAFVRLRTGRAHRIDKPGHVSNRIHVADIAQAIDAAFTRTFNGIVNVADGAPASPNDQIEYAAGLLGVPPPPSLSFEEAKRTLSPFVMSFYEGCARVRNERLTRELGVTLRYPDYRAGLQALLSQDFERDPTRA